jgi:adenine-specific DNA glycosylase
LTILLINVGQTVCGPTPNCIQCPIKAYCSIGREQVNNAVKIKKVVKKRKIEKIEKVENPTPSGVYTLTDSPGTQE